MQVERVQNARWEGLFSLQNVSKLRKKTFSPPRCSVFRPADFAVDLIMDVVWWIIGVHMECTMLVVKNVVPGAGPAPARSRGAPTHSIVG